MSTPGIEINREIASIANGRDITRGYTGPMLVNTDRVLRNRGGGDLAIYEQVLSEPQVKTTFEQRRKAVVKCDWQVDAASERRVDVKAADHVRQQLEKIGWDRVTDLMLYGVFYGYSVAEMIYEVDDGLLGWKAIKVRNRRRFRFDSDANLRLITPENALLGEPALAPYFWHFATGSDNDDEPYGLGLGHWCYWPALFKRNSIKFWLVFAEKFGMPTAVGKYDTAATDIERSRLLAAVGSIQTDAGIIMPKDMEVTLLEAARSGSADYKTLVDTMDETISKVVVGQTMTTDDGSSRSQAEVHQGVRQDIVKADADLVCESFNLGPVKWLCERNFPGAELPRVYREVEEPEDLDALAERTVKIKSIGFVPGLQWIKETFGEEWEQAEVPEQLAPAVGADGEPVLGPDGKPMRPAPGPAAPPTPPPSFADAGEPRDYAEATAPQLDRAIAAAPAWMAQIRQLVEQSASLEEIRDRLLELHPGMTLGEYADAMAVALGAAHLAGRNDVQDEGRARGRGG